jgi:hypothetical protein
MNHYVYYSYEEWGRGYVGSRSCKCLPKEDSGYLGSYSDKTFHPSGKIILYIGDSREVVNAVEVQLHNFFEVDINPHFANQAKQRSKGFFRSGPHTEETIAKIKRNRKNKNTGPSSLPREHFQKIGALGGRTGSRNQTWEDKKKGGDRCKEESLGFFDLSPEDNKVKSQRGAETTNQQRWRCLVTGTESTAGGLARWQRARGIDTSLRERVY